MTLIAFPTCPTALGLHAPWTLTVFYTENTPCTHAFYAYTASTRVLAAL